MLLGIYLVTTAISWATIIIVSKSCEKRLERKGYKQIKQKKSFIENVASSMSTIFKASLPVYNILNACVILFMGDKVYDELEKELLERGSIYIPKENNVNTQPEMKSMTLEKTNNVQKDNTVKKYEDMSIDEKIAYLEREKQSLLSQQTNQGPVLKRTNNYSR